MIAWKKSFLLGFELLVSGRVIVLDPLATLSSKILDPPINRPLWPTGKNTQRRDTNFVHFQNSTCHEKPRLHHFLGSKHSVLPWVFEVQRCLVNFTSFSSLFAQKWPLLSLYMSETVPMYTSHLALKMAPSPFWKVYTVRYIPVRECDCQVNMCSFFVLFVGLLSIFSFHILSLDQCHKNMHLHSKLGDLKLICNRTYWMIG